MNNKSESLPARSLSINEKYPSTSSSSSSSFASCTCTPPTDDIRINIHQLDGSPVSVSENTANLYSSSLNSYVSPMDDKSPTIMIFADGCPINNNSSQSTDTNYDTLHIKQQCSTAPPIFISEPVSKFIAKPETPDYQQTCSTTNAESDNENTNSSCTNIHMNDRKEEELKTNSNADVNVNESDFVSAIDIKDICVQSAVPNSKYNKNASQATDPELSDSDSESESESELETDAESTTSDEEKSITNKTFFQSHSQTAYTTITSMSTMIISQLPSIVTQSVNYLNSNTNTNSNSNTNNSTTIAIEHENIIDINMNTDFMNETNHMCQQLTNILSNINNQSPNNNNSNICENRNTLEFNSVINEVIESTATVSSYFTGPVQNRISHILNSISSSMVSENDSTSSSFIYGRISWIRSKITPYAYMVIEQLLLELYSILYDIIKFYDPNPKYNIIVCIIDKLSDIIQAMQGLAVLSDCFLGKEDKMDKK